MARSRNIKPGFFKNEHLGELEPLARILFAGLWCMADKEGRLEDRPKRIKVEVLPYDDCDVVALMDDLESAGFVRRYVSDGKKYLLIENWKRHQSPHHKEVDSILPDPPRKAQSIKEMKKEEGVSIPAKIREHVFDRDGRACVTCGAASDLTLDHILPQQMYGLHVPGNLRVLCRPCNSSRPVDGSDIPSLGVSIEQLKAMCVEEYQQIQSGTHACFKHEQASSVHAHEASNKNASCPTDSLNLIPDSLNSDSGQPADRFDDWWDAYPNKVKKKPCREIWKRRKLNTRADELIADVERRKAEDGRWLEGFIPDPTTYLNQDRWDDELTKRREKKQTEELWKLTDAELIERAQRKHISTSGKSRQQLIAALEAA